MSVVYTAGNILFCLVCCPSAMTVDILHLILKKICCLVTKLNPSSKSTVANPFFLRKFGGTEVSRFCSPTLMTALIPLPDQSWTAVGELQFPDCSPSSQGSEMDCTPLIPPVPYIPYNVLILNSMILQSHNSPLASLYISANVMHFEPSGQWFIPLSA